MGCVSMGGRVAGVVAGPIGLLWVAPVGLPKLTLDVLLGITPEGVAWAAPV